MFVFHGAVGDTRFLSRRLQRQAPSAVDSIPIDASLESPQPDHGLARSALIRLGSGALHQGGKSDSSITSHNSRNGSVPKSRSPARCLMGLNAHFIRR